MRRVAFLIAAGVRLPTQEAITIKTINGLILVLLALAGFTAQAQAQPILTQPELSAALAQAEPAGPVEAVETVAASQQSIEAAFDPHGRELEAEAAAESTTAAVPSKRPAASLALVIMRGHFEDVIAKVPRGASVPTGSVIAVVVNRDTGRVAATSVKNTAPTIPVGAATERPEVTASMKAQSASIKRWAKTARAQNSSTRAHSATWGNNCKPLPSYDHCYIVAEWNMKGAEEGYGATTEQRTSHIEVPGWNSGYFVDNEMWASNHTKANTWTEIGQQAGEYKGCCNLWWFYALQNSTEGYLQFVDAPYVNEVPLNVGNLYSMKWVGASTWCWYYGAGQELKACSAYFYRPTTQLEAGGEIATESKPSFAAASNNSVEWNNYTWHTWNFASVVKTTTGLCWSPLNGAPGNMYYDTC